MYRGAGAVFPEMMQAGDPPLRCSCLGHAAVQAPASQQEPRQLVVAPDTDACLAGFVKCLNLPTDQM